MNRWVRENEGKLLLVLIVVLIASIGGFRLYTGLVPAVFADAATTAIVGVIGGLIPLTYTKLTRPQTIIGPPKVQTEADHDMPSNSKHIRLPVEAKRGTVRNVEAKIVGGDDAFTPRGKNQLYWAGEFIPHGDDVHSDIQNEREVVEHMAEYHLESAGPIESISPDQGGKYVNLLIKIENFPATFLANAEGDSAGKYADCYSFISLYSPQEDSPVEFANGRYKIDIEVNAEGTVSKLKTIEFRTGPNFTDLKVIDSV